MSEDQQPKPFLEPHEQRPHTILERVLAAELECYRELQDKLLESPNISFEQTMAIMERRIGQRLAEAWVENDRLKTLLCERIGGRFSTMRPPRYQDAILVDQMITLHSSFELPRELVHPMVSAEIRPDDVRRHIAVRWTNPEDSSNSQVAMCFDKRALQESGDMSYFIDCLLQMLREQIANELRSRVSYRVTRRVP